MYHNLQHGQLFIRPAATHGGLNDVPSGVVAKFLDEPFSRPTSHRP
jgi:hypothetical protein